MLQVTYNVAHKLPHKHTTHAHTTSLDTSAYMMRARILGRHEDSGEKLFEKFLLNESENLELPIIATHEVFYLEQNMHEAHDAYLCIGEKTYVNVKDRRKYSNRHYLKTSNEMYELFKDLPDALSNNENFPLRISYRPKNSVPILPDIQTSKTKELFGNRSVSWSYIEKYM